MAKNIGFSIANSPLFKTAIAGEGSKLGQNCYGYWKIGRKCCSK